MTSLSSRLPLLCATLFTALASPASAQPAGDPVDHYGGRDMVLHVPARLPPTGARALVIVLHGGMGSADRIVGRQAESGLNLDAIADRDGFVVAYLNGTPVTRLLGSRALGWNAGGGCCGQPAQTGVDDVAYIGGARVWHRPFQRRDDGAADGVRDKSLRRGGGAFRPVAARYRALSRCAGPADSRDPRRG
jgi:hypothetical protein